MTGAANIVGKVLVGVVLTATTDNLVPSAVDIVLGRRPVVAPRAKSANPRPAKRRIILVHEIKLAKRGQIPVAVAEIAGQIVTVVCR